MALSLALVKILDINKARKRKLSQAKQHKTEQTQMREELKLLNKIVDQQANLVQIYEYQLTQSKGRNMPERLNERQLIG